MSVLPIYLLAHLLFDLTSFISTMREILRRSAGSAKPTVTHPQRSLRIVVPLNNNWVITYRASDSAYLGTYPTVLCLRTYKVTCAASIVAYDIF